MYQTKVHTTNLAQLSAWKLSWWILIHQLSLRLILKNNNTIQAITHKYNVIHNASGWPLFNTHQDTNRPKLKPSQAKRKFLRRFFAYESPPLLTATKEKHIAWEIIVLSLTSSTLLCQKRWATSNPMSMRCSLSSMWDTPSWKPSLRLLPALNCPINWRSCCPPALVKRKIMHDPHGHSGQALNEKYWRTITGCAMDEG